MRHKFRQAVRAIGTAVPFVVLGAVSIAASLFVFLNGFELATNVNIPYAFAIEPAPVDQLVRANQAADADAATSTGNFGQPKYLKLATQTTKLALVPGVRTGDDYLARAAVGHFVFLGKAKSGNLGNTLVYVRTSWRSIGHPEAITVGTNVFLDTDKDWRYMYRVTDTVELPATTPYLVPDSAKPHLCLAFVSADSATLRIVLADFVNLQNIQQ